MAYGSDAMGRPDGEIGGWIVVLVFVIIATAGMTIWMLTTDMTIYEP